MRVVSCVLLAHSVVGIELKNDVIAATFDAAGALATLADTANGGTSRTITGDGFGLEIGDLPFPTKAVVHSNKKGIINGTCPSLNSPPPLTSIDQCAYHCMATAGCESWTSAFADYAYWGTPRTRCVLHTCTGFDDTDPSQNSTAGLKPVSTTVKLTAASCKPPVVTSPSPTMVQALFSGCSGGYRVNVTYELATGWHFVTKHLSTCKMLGGACDPAAGFTVRHVNVWPGLKPAGMALGAMAFNPYSRQTEFGETYAKGSGETASFWRDGKSTSGLFASVQNSFMETGEGSSAFRWSSGRWNSLNYGAWQLGATNINSKTFIPAAVYGSLNIVGKTARGGADAAMLVDSAVPSDKATSVSVTLVQGQATNKPVPTPLKNGYAGIVFGAAGTPATATTAAQVDGFAAVVTLAKGMQKVRLLMLSGALDNASSAKVLKEAPLNVLSDAPLLLEVSAPAKLSGVAKITLDGHVVLTVTLPTRRSSFIANAGGVGVVTLDQDASFVDFTSSATPTTKSAVAPESAPLIQGKYSPMMKQVPSLGEWFVADAGVLGVTKLVGYEMPETGVDLGERDAFTACVENFLLDLESRKAGAVRLQVAWDSNDYQMDMAKEADRVEYKRLVTRNAQLGIKNVIFGPRNTDVASRWDHTDNWWWEEILWFQMGIGIRNGSWVPSKDDVPPSVQSMLDFFKEQKVDPIAYVYPTLAWQGDGQEEWLYINPSRDTNPLNMRATLASPKLQDYLIDTMVKFLDATGGKGFAWDYGIQGDPTQTNMYAEVHGWRRVLKALRAAKPDMVMDHRQIAHHFGPWYNLAGSYSEPIAGDENPESYGATLASLSTDHILADNLRLTNYRYRLQLLPNDRVPGFMFHQTERHFNNGTGEDTPGKPGDKHDSSGAALWRPDPMPDPKTGNYSGNTYSNCVMAMDWHTRDFDFLGYRYSVLSTVGTAGRNLVLGNIPARNLEEFEHFPQADITWMRKWFDFVDTHADAIKKTMPLLGYEWPRLGHVDGTVATYENAGFIFLYNPSPNAADATVRLDASLGLTGAATDSWLFTEIYPREEGMNLGVWQFEESVTVTVPGGSVRVLELAKWAAGAHAVAFNISYTSIALADGAAVAITGASELTGSANDIVVRLPTGSKATTLTVNGKAIAAKTAKCAFADTDTCLSATVTFTGSASLRYNAIAAPAPTKPSSTYATHITATKEMFAQLEERQNTYNISWTEEDEDASWLIPSRLLLYLYVARPTPSLREPVVTIQGKSQKVYKQYNSRGNHAIVPAGGGAVSGNTARTFLGWYVDLSELQPDASHGIVVTLPWTKDQQEAHPFSGIYWHNIEDGFSTEVVA